MHSLYQALMFQHARQLTPVRCAEQTITQLHHYFEDVVLENNLAALVVESLPRKRERSTRNSERIAEVARAARHAFFFITPDDALYTLPSPSVEGERAPVLLPRVASGGLREHFILIADARFSALLVTSPDEQSGAADPFTEHDVIWTFEPDVVYSALEYLMARVTAERFKQTKEFAAAVRRCMPKTTSLHLTVSVTTKLARLLQEQAAREVAVNRIASAIRSTLELPSILQTTVNEVGRALGARACALRIEGEAEQSAMTKFYARAGVEPESEQASLQAQLDACHTRLVATLKQQQADGHKTFVLAEADRGARMAFAPLAYQESYMGVLVVRTDDAQRVWQQSERLLLRTVADQVALAVSHARLFAQIQRQALTDALTGCFNRRAFDLQLERDLNLATRTRQSVALIMLDIDHFKRVNDTHGHDAGDAALRFLAEVLRAELRSVDTAARYGGEEFAIILPQADLDGALLVSERLRARLERTDVPIVGHITASFGLAAFPQHASTPAQLVTLADQALYEAKSAGRNRICAPPSPLDIPTDVLDEATPPATIEPESPVTFTE
jgi:diguanylate cyclase (GGDEF)-like protein